MGIDPKIRQLVRVTAVLGTLTALGLGCQHTERSNRDPEDAAPRPDSAPEGGFSTGACYGCISSACGAPISACNSEPSCASYLACLGTCPALPDGTADPACVCPPAAGSTGVAAQAALDQCFAGAAATCIPCGGGPPDAAPEGGFSHPVLRQQCAPSLASDVCERCQLERCCDSRAAVSGGPATDLAECFTACPDSVCDQGCYDQFPEGIPGFGGFGACLGVRCIATGDCQSRGGACSLCSYRECPEEYAACSTDVDCFLARACTGNCQTADPACGSACRAAHPNGVAKYDALGVCLGQKCIEVCGG